MKAIEIVTFVSFLHWFYSINIYTDFFFLRLSAKQISAVFFFGVGIGFIITQKKIFNLKKKTYQFKKKKKERKQSLTVGREKVARQNVKSIFLFLNNFWLFNN